MQCRSKAIRRKPSVNPRRCIHIDQGCVIENAESSAGCADSFFILPTTDITFIERINIATKRIITHVMTLFMSPLKYAPPKLSRPDVSGYRV